MWVILGLSLCLLGLLVALSWSEIQSATASLLGSGAEPAGWQDRVALGALQLAYVPNVAVWVAAYLLGAGFAVGADTHVSPFTVEIGTLPTVPLAAIIPEQPLAWPWLPLVLVGLGALFAGGWVRTGPRRIRVRVVFGLAVAFCSAWAMAFAAAASSGGLGPGRLAEVGPAMLPVWAATMLVVGVGQVLWAVLPTLISDVGPFVAHAARRWRIAAARRAGRRSAVRSRRAAADLPGTSAGPARGRLRRRGEGGRRGRRRRAAEPGSGEPAPRRRRGRKAAAPGTDETLADGSSPVRRRRLARRRGKGSGTTTIGE